MIFRKTAIAALLTTGLAGISGQAFAHQTYNLTGAGITIGDSVNNTDGVSNTGGYGPVGIGGRVAGDANANIPGTGGLPTDYTGTLPYNFYFGHHDSTATGQTNRNYKTGTSATETNSLWRAYAVQNASTTWGPLLPDGGANDHPYVAVGGDSWQTGSTTGGLDYALIHASAGSNDNAQNVTTATGVWGGTYNIDITVKRDANYDSLNDANALLDVALYRGSDTSIFSNRTAAFDPNAAGVQGSSLGTGGVDGSALLWSASQVSVGDILTYTLSMDFAEWQKTDAVAGSLNDGDAGFYTLVVGAHGGASNSALAYTVDTHSYSTITAAPVPVPGAVWLFGSAIAGLIGFGRRKPQLAA
ncbi:hypothetical protein QZJ86_04100 [Methylomonas montana]|uniref:hypothetical protein n=1 Tax=Methylomonas montana TaxID=3058963 RepID=UPI002658724C|nr:hypothetical protein [Methylomonas montana]WKJ91320.1 hypothetical protein QZJ86_04100 [Methylomonas montana]